MEWANTHRKNRTNCEHNRAILKSRPSRLDLLHRAAIESLETRTLLSTVYVNADSGANSIYIHLSGETVQIFQNQPPAATPTFSLPIDDDDDIAVIDGNGNNTITVDYSGGDPIAGGLFFQGGVATDGIRDTLNLIHTGGANFSLNHSDITAYSSTINDTINFQSSLEPFVNLVDPGSTNQITVNSGAYTFDSDLGAGNAATSLTVARNASVAFSTTQHLSSLTIAANANATMLSAGGQVLDTTSLTVSGTLDLTNNDLIVNNPGSAMTTLESATAAGDLLTINDSAGPIPHSGIGSSTDLNDGLFLGYAPQSVVQLPSLDGQAISSSALVVRNTFPADFNLDGAVNFGDLGVLAQNFNEVTGSTPPLFYEGDGNLDGYVNGLDFGLLAQEINTVAVASPTNLTINQTYTVPLPTQTPTGDTILRWDIDWGDGNVDSYQPGDLPGTTTPITGVHAYTTAGAFNLQMSALTGSGSVYRPTATAIAVSAAGSFTSVSLAATSPDDAFTISSDTSGNTTFSQNGTVIQTVPTASLLSINLTGDTTGTLTIDFTNGDPLPVSGVFADSSAIDITGSSHADTLFTTATAAVFGDAVIRHLPSVGVTFLNAGAGDQLVSLSGAVYLNGDPDNTAGPSVFVNTDSEVLFNGSQHLSALNILPAGTARMVEAGNDVLVTNTLNIADQTEYLSGGLLDLADNDLIVKTGDSSTLTNIATWLTNGYNGGLWNNNSNWPDIEPAAIDSTVAGTFDQEGNLKYDGVTTLGYAQIGSNQGDLPLSSFDNQPVNTGAVVVKYTYYGDANLDGNVDSTDEAMVNNGITNNLTGWTNGDFYYQGSIDSGSLDVLNLVEAMGVVPGTISFAADSAFPTGSLPTTLPDGSTPIASWNVSWGTGQTSSFAPASTFEVPYSNANGSYFASFTALDANGAPEYHYPATSIGVNRTGPSNLSAIQKSPNEIDLSWSGFSSTYATVINVYISTDGTTFSYFDSVAGNLTAAQAIGLTPNTTYTFEACAADSNRSQSTPSNHASATTYADPWNVQATGPASDNEGDTYQLDLTVNPSGSAPAFGLFTVDWGDGSAPSTYTLAQLPASHTFLTGIDSSIVDVTATTASGVSPALTLTAAPIEVDMVPKAPANIQVVSPSPTEVDLTWTDNSQDADGYDVLRSLDDGATFQAIAQVSGTDTAYDDTTLAPGSSPEYEVEAVGNSALNASPPAAAPSITTPSSAAPTGTPTLSAVTDPNNADSVLLTYTYSGTDDSGFEIEMEDQASGENFHTVLTPGAVPTVGPGAGSGTASIGNLVVGDGYEFRIRADHVGGTASHYVNVGFTLNDTGDISVTATAASGGEQTDCYIAVSWSASSAAAAAHGGITSYNVQWRGSSLVGDGAHTDWAAQPVGANTTSINCDVGHGQTGQWRVQGVYTDGSLSAWGYSGMVTEGDNYGHQPMVSAHVVSTTSVDLTFSDDAEEDTNPFYSAIYYGIAYAPITATPGSGTTVFLPESQRVIDPGAVGTILVTDLTPGVLYDFMVVANWHQPGFNGDPFDESGFNITHEYVDTAGGVDVAPAAPDKIWAVNLGDGVNQDRVELIWHNTSNNEDGFLVQKSTQPNFSGNVSQYTVGADVTNFIDTQPVSRKTVYYRVASYRGTAVSAWTSTFDILTQSPLAVAISWFPASTPDLDLEALALLPLSNDPPPENFLGAGSPLADYIAQKEYRNILELRVAYSVDPYSGAFTVSPHALQIPGYTPIPLLVGGAVFHVPGQSFSYAPTITYNSDRSQAIVTFTGLFRLHPIEQAGAFTFNGLSNHGGFHFAAWAWATIAYAINNQGYAQVLFTGSSVPNQTDYIDGFQSDSYDVDDNRAGYNAFLGAPYGSLGPVDNR